MPGIKLGYDVFLNSVFLVQMKKAYEGMFQNNKILNRSMAKSLLGG